MLSGGLLIVPWFFLDLTDADKIEANAQRARYNYLVDRGVKRNCRLKIPHIKKFYFDDKGYKKRNRWLGDILGFCTALLIKIDSIVFVFPLDLPGRGHPSKNIIKKTVAK